MLLGVETGGTTIRAAVADDPMGVLAAVTLPTEHPAQTLPRLASALTELVGAAPVACVGVAAFGPVDVRPESATYGRLGATPKTAWRGVDLRAAVSAVVDAPRVSDTDVCAAAVAERRWGAGRGRDDVCYITVGTGIGVGAVVAGSHLHGTGHPELGHLPVPRAAHDDLPGVCPLHGDCLEGLASGPAIAARWGRPADALGDATGPACALEAYYLAHLVVTLVYALAPAVVVLGGGVAGMPGLVEATSAAAGDLLGGTLAEHPLTMGGPFVVPSALPGRAGLVGALTLASDALLP